MRDIRDPEEIGNTLLTLRQLAPEMKLSQVADQYFSNIGDTEAGGAPFIVASNNGVGPRGEGVVESDDS